MARSTRNRCRCGFDYSAEKNRHRRVCGDCGQKRVPKSKPKHLAALEVPYADYITLNGGEHCAICGAGPSEQRRLDRDHDHQTGMPRGLLCHRHNRMLSPRLGWTPEHLEAAASYLRKAA